MPLPWKERLTMVVVSAPLYYRYRIADEARWGEHELNVLGDIVHPVARDRPGLSTSF